MRLPQEENVDYVSGKLDGLVMALNIVNMRDVNNNTVRWLVREMNSLRERLKVLTIYNIEEEE